MRNFLKRYKVQLEVVTPIYIGSGQELTKKEYIYCRNSNEAWIPNKKKLLRDIMNKDLIDEFEQYMLNGKEFLLDWMNLNGYSDKEIKNLCDYVLDCSQLVQNGSNLFGIQEFVKDAYGMPYIPGSSLKGAIRSSILGSDILKNKREYDKIRQDIINSNDIWKGKPNKKYLDFESRNIEKVNIKNNMWKGIHVGDSVPLGLESLVLCQKIDVTLEEERIYPEIPILRECIKPGTIVEFEMTIDTNVCKLSEKEILQALYTTYDYYQKTYVEKFINETKEKGNLYLGGGCGFGTKTVLYELLGEKEGTKVISKLMNLKFPEHEHLEDIKKGVSPHMLKCTNYDGEICEMGKCKMEIIQI